ncbi:virion encapsidated RNAP [Erwinia phage Pastis]|nr:virion encapsidated RNAP [Erwinia phage Pastis]
MAENNFSSLVQQKMANVNAASAQKQAAIDPTAYAAKTLLSQYANGTTPLQKMTEAVAQPQPFAPGVDKAPAAAPQTPSLAAYVNEQNQIRRENLGNQEYAPDAFVSDTGDKFMAGTATTIGNLGQIAPTVVGSAGSLLNNIDATVQNAIAPEVSPEDRAIGLGQPAQGTLGNDILALTGGMQKRIQLASDWLAKPWNDRVSEQGQVKSEQFQRQQEAARQQEAKQRKQDIADGSSTFMADLRDVGRGFMRTAAAYAQNPSQAVMDTAENLPQLGANVVLGGTSTLGNAAVAGLMEASGMYQQVKQDMDKMSDADLLRNSARAQQLQAQGYNMSDIRDLVLAQAVGEAAPLQFGATMLAAPLGGKLETGLAGKGFGETAASRFRNRAAAILGEGADETINSATGGMAANLAAQQNYDPNKRVLEDVGEQAAQGGLVGLGMAGVTSAPGQAVDATILAARAAGNGALSALGALQTTAEARRANNADNQAAEADANAQSAAFTDAVNNFDPTVGQANAEPTPNTQETPQPAGDVGNTQPGDIPAANLAGDVAPVNENIFSPEGRAIVDGLASTGMNDAQQLAAVHDVINNNPDMPAEQRRALEIYASDRLGNLIAHMEDVLAPAYEAETDADTKKALGNQIKTINTIVQAPETKKFLEAYSPDNVSDTEFDATLAALPETITPENINTPEVQNGLRAIKEKSLYRPLDISTDQYQKVLDHDTTLSPMQRQLIEAKKQLADFVATHDSVSENIRNTSRGGFKSVKDHALGVINAMQRKDGKGVQLNLDALRKFAETEQARFKEHDRILGLVRATGLTSDEYTEVPGYYRLDGKGNRGGKKLQFVNHLNTQNIENIEQDTNHIVDVYNALLASVPSAQGESLLHVNPTWKTRGAATPQEIADFQQEVQNRRTTQQNNIANKADANAQQTQTTAGNTDNQVSETRGAPEQSGVPATKSEPVSSESRPDAAIQSAESVSTVQSDVAPATYDQPALSEADVRELPDDQIADLMTEAQNHIAENGFDQAAQDNFRTLSEEQSRREKEPVEEEDKQPSDNKEVTVDSEKAAPVGQRVLEMVPLTNAAFDEKGTAAEKAARTNQLRATFQSRTNSDSRYDLGVLNSMTQEQAAELVGNKYEVTEPVMKALGTIQESVRSIAKAMNQRLKALDAKEKIAERADTARPVSALGDRKALFATLVQDGKVAYIPEVQESLGLAAMHWHLNATAIEYDAADVADMLGIARDDVTDAMVAEVNRAGITLKAAANQIAGMTEQLLGIQERKDTSRTYGRNITNALARETLAAMQNAGMVEVVALDIPGANEKLNMLRVIRNEALDETLNGTKSIIQDMLLPKATSGYSLGTNTLQPPRTVNGDTWQEVPKEVQTAIKAQQAVPFKLNREFRDMFETLLKLKGNGALVAAGYDERDLSNMNREHAAVIESKNRGLVNGMIAAGQLEAEMQAYADKNGMDIHDVPIHWDYHMDTNGRMRVKASYNWQNNKVMRELFVSTTVPVELDNPQHMREFQLHLAQGLGIKVDKMSNDDAIEKVNALLANDLTVQGAIAAMEKGLSDGWDSVTESEADAITDAVRGKDNKYLHTLLSAAKWNVALANGDKTFNHAVTFEVDGVTDGPGNAFVHFGMTVINEFSLGVLRKIGWNVNSPDMPSNKTYDKKLNPDLYITSAGNITDLLYQDKTEAAEAVRSLLVYAGQTEQDGENQRDAVTRSFAKLVVTPATYGSGERSMSATIGRSLVESLYSHLSDVLVNGETLNTPMLAMMDKVLGRQYFSRLANASEKQIREFRVSPEALETFQKNLFDVLGNPLYNGIDQTVGGALVRNKELAALTNIQGIMFKDAWQKAYDALRQKRVDEGVLADNEMLSLADEQAVTKEVQHLAPIFQNGVTGNDVTNGFNMLTMNQNGMATDYLNDRTIKRARVTAMDGSLASTANGTEVTPPGVRTIALATIGGGDATMMTKFFNKVPRKNIVANNVFDGLDTRVGDMEAASDMINEAVREGWNTDLYRNIVTGTAKALENLDFAALSDKAFQDVYRSITGKFLPDFKVKPLRNAKAYEDLRGQLDNMLTQHKYRAAKNAYVRQALLEAYSTISHMGGVDKAYNTGTVSYIGSPADVIAALNDRVAELAAADKSAIEFTNDKAVTDAFGTYGTTREDGIVTLTKDQLMNALTRLKFKSNISRELFKRLALVLSENLQVFHGSAEQITQLQQKMFPDVVFNESANATTYGNVIFLRSASEETVFHEAIHAGIQNAVNMAYTNPSVLTEDQRTAVGNMENLMNQFMKLSAQNTDFPTARTLQYAQNQIGRYVNQGDTASAVNEFVAWTLANQRLQALAGTVANTDAASQVDSRLVSIISKLKNAVLRLLGWPVSNNGQSVLESLAGNFDNLVQTLTTDPVPSMFDLSQSLDHSTILPDHINRLDDMVQRLEAAVGTRVKQTGELLAQNARERSLIHGDTTKIVNSLKEFLAAGWNLSPKEEHAFKLMQVTLASGIQLNPTAMNAMQRLYDSVMPTLTTNDMSQAQLDALKGKGTIFVDGAGRTNQLANFIALGVTSEQFRKVLAERDIPRREKASGDIMEKMAQLTKDAIDFAADFGNGTRSAKNAAGALDVLAEKIAVVNQQAKDDLIDAPTTLLNKGDTYLARQIEKIGEKAGNLATQRMTNGQTTTKTDAAVNALLNAVSLLDKKGQGQEALQSTLNGSKLWEPVYEFITEALGSDKTSVVINRMLQQAKNQVSAVRQKIREGVPKNIQSKFTRELTKDEWTAMNRAFGKTDMQSLLSAHSLDDVHSYLTDEKALENAVKAAESAVMKHAFGADYVVRSKELAHYMMTGENISDHLLRNAVAISELVGTGKTVQGAENAVENIDHLVSLYAMQQLLPAERATMDGLFKNERAGLEFVSNYLNVVNANEKTKLGNYNNLNAYKGNVPTVTVGHKNLVVADAKTGKNLVQNHGYIKVPGYVGDSDLGNNTLSYYYTDENLTAGYTQGALQTVEPTVYGTDPVTGRTVHLRGSFGLSGNAARTMARQKAHSIQNAKLGTQPGKLMPVFNLSGEVTGYEAAIPDAVRNEKLEANNNLSEMLGVWQGRQAEEALAQRFNEALANKLADIWKAEKSSRKDEYIDLAESAKTNKVHAEAWAAVPRGAQEMLKAAFGDEPVMVRRDMLNNAFGYRNFSVSALFTQQSELPSAVQEGIVTLATAILGAKAPRYLRKTGRYTQDAVSMAKDWIIVRSVSVFAMNLVGNFIQLGQNGVGLKAIFKGQAAKMQEVDAYLRNINKMNQLHSDNLGSTDPVQIKRNKMAIQRLHDANSRMSIAPLIEAGELPTVAEGLTIEDDNAIRGGALNWVEHITARVPKGVSDAVKLAMIAKGTPLHNGLNRMMTYGDFVAKAVLFDKLTKQDGLSKDAALKVIQEEFINYDNNPGRTRTWVESHGFTWFLTYKLKIQKILLRRMRDNPLSTLVYQGVADGLGIDSPFEANVFGDNFWYSFSDPTRVLDAPSLHPVAQLLR